MCACASCKESVQRAGRDAGVCWSCFQPPLSFSICCAGSTGVRGRIPSPARLVCSLLTSPLCPSLGTNGDASTEGALWALLELGRKSTIHLEKGWDSERGSSFLALHIYMMNPVVCMCTSIIDRNICNI